MPALEEILTEDLLRSPLFLVALLRDVATLYGFGHVPGNLSAALELSEVDLNNRSVMTYIWFTNLLDSSQDTIRCCSDKISSNSWVPEPFCKAAGV